jgi:hypothetical protein
MAFFCAIFPLRYSARETISNHESDKGSSNNRVDCCAGRRWLSGIRVNRSQGQVQGVNHGLHELHGNQGSGCGELAMG